MYVAAILPVGYVQFFFSFYVLDPEARSNSELISKPINILGVSYGSVEAESDHHEAYRHRTTQTLGGHISMHRVRFQSTIPVFGRQKTVHGLDSTVGHCDLK
jgi:hypothetical protein